MRRIPFFASLLALSLPSCGGGGGGSSAGGGSPPEAPSSLVAIADDGAARLSWSAVSGASGYSLYWSNTSGVNATSGTRIAGATSPYTHAGLTNGQAYYYVVAAHNATGEGAVSAQASATPATDAGGTRYDPSWGGLSASQTIFFSYNGSRSAAQNGQDLADSIDALAPGDKLSIGTGDYALPADYTIRLQGNSGAPIVIAATSGATVTLTRADAAGPVVGIGGQGAQSASQYLVLRGMEITGGGVGVAIHKASQIWIDRCHIHDTGGAGIRVSTEDAERLHLTRNEIHDTTSFGEGIRLGDETLGSVTHHAVVALNHIHDTRAALEGDGVELQQNCYANWIAENVIHHTKYPAILFHGTGGQTVNTIERNVCYDSQDNVMQAEAGEAIVRNNVLVGPAGNKIFDSSHSESTLQNLTVVHNTMIAQGGYGAGLFAWNGQTGLVFANNAVYSRNWGAPTYAVAYRSGYAGGTLAGNVVLGNTPDVPGSLTQGAGLSDFAGVAGWSYTFSSLEDLLPSAGSVLLGAADPSYPVTADISGTSRPSPADVGAIERP